MPIQTMYPILYFASLDEVVAKVTEHSIFVAAGFSLRRLRTLPPKVDQPLSEKGAATHFTNHDSRTTPPHGMGIFIAHRTSPNAHRISIIFCI